MAEAKVRTRPATLAIEVRCDGQVIGLMSGPVRTFKTGKAGYFIGGKTMLPNGEQLQVSANFVIPHSEIK